MTDYRLPIPETPMQDWMSGLSNIGLKAPMPTMQAPSNLWNGADLSQFLPQSYSLAGGMSSGQGLKMPGAASSAVLGGGVAPSSGWDWGKFSDFLFGKENTDGSKSFGAAAPILGGLQSLGNLWLGMQQYGLMKDQLSFQKDSFNKNYRNSVQSYNTQLEGRAKARASADPTAESAENYMVKHGLKG